MESDHTCAEELHRPSNATDSQREQQRAIPECGRLLRGGRPDFRCPGFRIHEDHTVGYGPQFPEHRCIPERVGIRRTGDYDGSHWGDARGAVPSFRRGAGVLLGFRTAKLCALRLRG